MRPRAGRIGASFAVPSGSSRGARDAKGLRAPMAPAPRTRTGPIAGGATLAFPGDPSSRPQRVLKWYFCLKASGEIQRSSVKELRQDKKAVDQQRRTLSTTARCKAVGRNFPVLVLLRLGKGTWKDTYRPVKSSAICKSRGMFCVLGGALGKAGQGSPFVRGDADRTGTDTEKFCGSVLEDGKVQTSQPLKQLRQAEFSSIVGKVSWRERQSRKSHKATHEQQGNCKSSGKQKEASPGMRDQWGIWKVVTLLPCSCYHPQITFSHQLQEVQPSPSLPSCSSILPSFHVMAWFSHSPLQWQNVSGHLDFGSVASSGLPLLNLLKFPLVPFFSRDGGSWCVSAYSDQCC
ncbi:uncharacterized protein LOC131557594 [Ammospiza caudacuta]|uniref:uncharacterized protein LOC131557594 n=1 Tax=Ammospiza caudacuta TaxID=2857398 RepID=UPI002739A2D6|nr:uncharacterized protein LOC131557594 [Ammospiza caudacuta]